MCRGVSYTSSSSVKGPEKHSSAEMSPLCCHGIQFILTSTWSVCSRSPLATLTPLVCSKRGQEQKLLRKGNEKLLLDINILKTSHFKTFLTVRVLRL